MDSAAPAKALLIREMTPADAEIAALLCAELGYPVAPEVMQRRIEDLTPLPDHALFVACRFSSVMGWIHVCIVQHLQAERRAEVAGLVVSAKARSAGVGRQLLAQAEKWAAEHGIHSVVVRSNIAREAAHRFYLREGYARTKTSAVFTKTLSL
jgi:GNAT superfamily N-acetyltransferase